MATMLQGAADALYAADNHLLAIGRKAVMDLSLCR
jgi:hypothetical protein